MRTFTYLPLLILWSAGLTASAGIAQEFPTINAPGMRPCRQMTWSLLVDIPHFSAVCLIDKYSIQHLIFGILFLGIKRRLYYRCNCEQCQISGVTPKRHTRWFFAFFYNYHNFQLWIKPSIYLTFRSYCLFLFSQLTEKASGNILTTFIPEAFFTILV